MLTILLIYAKRCAWILMERLLLRELKLLQNFQELEGIS